MSKKEYILKLLETLIDIREPAKGLKLLVENNEMDEATIEKLYNAFKASVKEVVQGVEKEKLEKGILFLEKLKTLEADGKKQDEKDLEELDQMLENM